MDNLAKRSELSDALAAHQVHNVPRDGEPYAFGRFHPDRFSYHGYYVEFRRQLRVMERRLRGKGGADRKLLIFARPRSGTTLLVDLLKQVENMRCDGEVLHFAVRNPAKFIELLPKAVDQSAYGCKLLSYQMLEVQRLRDPLDFFDAALNAGFRIVHLRRDTTQQCLSLATAMQTKIFAVRPGRPESDIPPEVEIDPQRFKQLVEWNKQMLSYEDMIMSGVPHMRLQYEEDLIPASQHQVTVDRICDYLGHPSSPVAARLKRTGGGAGRTRVRNKDALMTIAEELIGAGSQS